MQQQSMTELSRSGSQPEDQLKVACLRVGQQWYALDIMCIKEIIRPLPIVEVPKAPDYVDGVIDLRKAVIPVVNLRRRFGLDAIESSAKQRILICAVETRIVGLLVDSVTEVFSCPVEELRPTPYYLSVADTEFFPGVCRKGARVMMLLDLRKLLTDDKPLDLRHQQSDDRPTDDR